jgi:hypothetical protein
VSRLTLVMLFAFLLLIGSAAAPAQNPPDQPEPPVRLKKKTRPAPEPDKAESKSKEDEKKKAVDKKEPLLPETDIKGRTEPDAPVTGPDPREIMGRVSKNMRASEERLADKDSGDQTQQIQRDILKDLDSLIEESRRQQQQQQQQQGGGAGSSQSQNQQDRQSRRASRNRSLAQRQPQSRPEVQPNQQRADAEQGTGGKKPRGDMNQIADLYKDIWGHLPATLRQEMDQYAREQFMSKYNELLKQYYATIAEKSRRKGD